MSTNETMRKKQAVVIRRITPTFLSVSAGSIVAKIV